MQPSNNREHGSVVQILLRNSIFFGLAVLSLATFCCFGVRGISYYICWISIHACLFGLLELKLLRQVKLDEKNGKLHNVPILLSLFRGIFIDSANEHCECCSHRESFENKIHESEKEKEEAEILSKALENALRLKTRQNLRPPSILTGHDDVERLESIDNYMENEADPQSIFEPLRDTHTSVSGSTSFPTDLLRRHDQCIDSTMSTLSATPQVLQYEIGGHNRAMMRRNPSHFVTEEQDMIRDLLECVSDTNKAPNPSPWRLVQHRHDVRIWVSEVPDSPWLRIRGRMRCVATPAELLSLLIDDQRIQEYDRLFDSVRHIERIDDCTCIRWSSYRALWPARARDFVIKTTWEEFADGTVVISTRSVTHPDCPETPTFERGNMIMCGYVVSPREIIPGTETEPLTPKAGLGDGFPSRSATSSVASFGSPSDNEEDSKINCPIGGAIHGSEVTMYSHTDLGGAMPATIINRLCMKPAYRVLRKIQKLAAAGSVVVSPTAPLQPTPRSKKANRTKSEDLLTSLLENSTLEERNIIGELETMRTTSFAHEVSDSNAIRPSVSTAFAAAEARRIMALLERMASEKNDWVRLGSRNTKLGVNNSSETLGDMALYKWPIPRTNRVRLGASAMVRANAVELLGLLLESAAMLGPDYVVDGQENIETLSSTTGTASAASTLKPTHDTAVIWFSCTHRRQRMRRDFVVLRCYRQLTRNESDGGLIAYASIDHPAYPPTSSFVRGKIEMCGFVVLPHGNMAGSNEQFANTRRSVGVGALATAAVAVVVDVVGAVTRGGGSLRSWSPKVPPSPTPISPTSEVYFYTHLSFSENLPALEDVQASRYLLGPLHILRELRRVVDRTIEYSDSTPGGGYNTELRQETEGGITPQTGLYPLPNSGENSSSEGARCTNSSLKAKREEALRDLLVLASDGECMDGPQADWNLVRDGGDVGTRLWKCEQPGSAWSMIRTRAKLNAMPTSVLSLLLDESRIKDYDDMFDSIHMIERVDEFAMYKRTVYKPVWPTAPRDFCLLSSWGTLEDGSAYLVNRSVDHPNCPEIKGYVRGFLMMCGFLMVPSPGRNGGCTLTMVVHTELGGSLPPSIINKISTGAPAQVSLKLQKIFN